MDKKEFRVGLWDEFLGISPILVNQLLSVDVETLVALLGKNIRAATGAEAINRWLESLFHQVFPDVKDTRPEREAAKARHYLEHVRETCCQRLCEDADAISTLEAADAVLKIARLLLKIDPLLASRASRTIVATIIYKEGLDHFCSCETLPPREQTYPF